MQAKKPPNSSTSRALLPFSDTGKSYVCIPTPTAE